MIAEVGRHQVTKDSNYHSITGKELLFSGEPFEMLLAPEDHKNLQQLVSGRNKDGFATARLEVLRGLGRNLFRETEENFADWQREAQQNFSREFATDPNKMDNEAGRVVSSTNQFATANAQQMIDFIMIAYLCSCERSTCGSAAAAGCPIGRDTESMRLFQEAISFPEGEPARIRIDPKKIEKAHELWFQGHPIDNGRMCGKAAACVGACTYTKMLEDLRAAAAEGKQVGDEYMGVLMQYYESYLSTYGLHMGLFDKFYQPVEEQDKNGMKVAVIGAGPAGLVLASQLADQGFDVTIYEKRMPAEFEGKVYDSGVMGTINDGVTDLKIEKWVFEEFKQLVEHKIGKPIQFGVEVGPQKPVAEVEQEHDFACASTGLVSRPRKFSAKFIDHEGNEIPHDEVMGDPSLQRPNGNERIIYSMDFLTPRNEYSKRMRAELDAKHPNIHENSPQRKELETAWKEENPREGSVRGKTVIVIGKGYTGDDDIESCLKDMSTDGTAENLDGSIFHTNRKMKGEPKNAKPQITEDREQTLSKKMFYMAQQNNGGDKSKNSFEQLFFLEPEEVHFHEDNSIAKIVFTQRICTNPSVAAVFPEKAEYKVLDKKEVWEYEPGNDVVIHFAGGYDARIPDKMAETLGLVEDGKVVQPENYLMGRPRWFAAGDLASTAPGEQDGYEQVHAVNKAKLAAEKMAQVARIATKDGELPEDPEARRAVLAEAFEKSREEEYEVRNTDKAPDHRAALKTPDVFSEVCGNCVC